MRPLLDLTALRRRFEAVTAWITGTESVMSDWVIGIDVSQYQGGVRWRTAIDAGAKFAFVRASNGGTVDARFEENAQKLPPKRTNFGFHFGYYFPYYPSLDWKYQADVFCNLIEDLEWDLPPVIDAESRGDWSMLDEVAEYIELRLGVQPLIYCSPGVWNDELGSAPWASEYDLWVAFYSRESDPPYLPIPWSYWYFWQWSAGGDNNMTDQPQGATYGADSTDIDLDRWNGTQAGLDAYADAVWQTRFGAPEPPPEPPSDDLEQLAADIATNRALIEALRAKDSPTRDEHDGLIGFVDQLLAGVDNMRADLGALDQRIKGAGALFDTAASKLKDEA